MNPLSILQIAELSGAKLEQGDGKISTERISTDSRTIKKGELFVALRGENFDGHKFLEATSNHEVAVWEIGMNHPGEVAPLAKIAAPNAAIITNIGVAHIEFMGTREGIAKEKGALAEAVPAEGAVILNADDPFSKGIAERTNAHVIFAGTKEGTVRAIDIQQSAEGSEFTIMEGAHRCRAQLPVPGLHMVQNALLAVGAGRAC